MRGWFYTRPRLLTEIIPCGAACLPNGSSQRCAVDRCESEAVSNSPPGASSSGLSGIRARSPSRMSALAGPDAAGETSLRLPDAGRLSNYQFSEAGASNAGNRAISAIPELLPRGNSPPRFRRADRIRARLTLCERIR